MIIYLICFALSCSSFYLSCKSKNKVVTVMFEILGILIPCILAGCRDLSVGTDIKVYLKNIFDASLSTDSWNEYLNYGWFNGWKIVYVKDYEIAFIGVVYIISKTFLNIHVVMFFIEILMILPIYAGVKKVFKNNGSAIAFSMLVYYLSMFNSGLNIMRQYIAISFLFLSVICLINKKNIKCYIYIIISILFHKSSLIGILILILYNIMNSSIKFKIKIGRYYIEVKKILIIGISIVGLFIIYKMDIIMKLLDAVNLSEYSSYISGSFSMNLFRIIMVIPILFVMYRNKNNIFKEDNIYFYLLIYIISQLTIQLASIKTYTIRISYFFKIFDTIFLVIICKNNLKIKKSSSFIVIGTLLVYWIYIYVIGKSGQTVPYIIGI